MKQELIEQLLRWPGHLWRSEYHSQAKSKPHVVTLRLVSRQMVTEILQKVRRIYGCK